MTKLTWIVMLYLFAFVTSFKYKSMSLNRLESPSISYKFKHHTNYRSSLKTSIGTGTKSTQQYNDIITGSELNNLVYNESDDIRDALWWTVSCSWWAQVVSLTAYAAALTIEATQHFILKTICFSTIVKGINISTCLLALLSAWSMSKSYITAVPQQRSIEHRYRLLHRSAQFSIGVSILGSIFAIVGMESVLGPICGEILAAMMLQWSAPSTAAAAAAAQSSIHIDALAILNLQSYLTGIFAHFASLLSLYWLRRKLSHLSVQRPNEQGVTAAEDSTNTTGSFASINSQHHSELS